MKIVNNIITSAPTLATLLLASALSSSAANISYLGVETQPAWRSTDVAKNSAFDPDGDNAYGTDGVSLVTAGASGDFFNFASLTSSLPSYISSTTISGGSFTSSSYADLDNGLLAIASTVADLTAPGNAFTQSGRILSISFTATETSAAGFIVTALGVDNSQPMNTITLSGTGATTGTGSSANDTTSGVARLHFFQVSNVTAGDTFSITANRLHGIAFEAIPEPGTYALLAGLLALSAVALRRRR